MEKLKETMENLQKTMENWRTPWKIEENHGKLKKIMENWRKPWKIEKNHGKLKKTMEKLKKTMEKLKRHGTQKTFQNCKKKKYQKQFCTLFQILRLKLETCCFARVLLSLVSLGCCELRGFVRHVCLHPLPEPDHPREVGWRKGLLLSLENEHSIFWAK